jgi:hypothetical protein
LTDLLVVSGFADHGAIDRFVRSEIRYFRSRDMRAWRCEGAGPELRLAFGDRPDLGGLAADLSRAHPALELTWSRAERGRVLTRVFRRGDRGPETAADGRLEELAARGRTLEEIYGTF